MRGTSLLALRQAILPIALGVSAAFIAGCGCGGDNNKPPSGTAGITVAPTTGLTTTEMGGQAFFRVVLDALPTADVTIALTSSDTTEGTVSPASLTFSPENWDAPQMVTINGVDDDETDGTVTYMIQTGAASSDDAAYEGLDGADVSVSNVDNETAGITVTPTSGLMTTEAGGEDTFSVVLNSQPSAEVTIEIISSDEAEGTVGPAMLIFTAENWAAPQTVTVTGVDDDEVDGPVEYMAVTMAAASADGEYDGVDPADVTVTNIDDETAGVLVDPVDGLTTTEAGGQAMFTIVLNSAPSADVTFALSSSDETEGTVSPASVVFTAENWDAPQTVTASGVDDDIADGNQVYEIVTGAATSTDETYAGVDPDDVSVTNTDDDSAGVTVAPTTGLVTTESGGQATFTVVLNTEPTGDVTIDLSTTATDEVSIDQARLTFTMANWAAPQTVTLTGVNDDLADGGQPFTIALAAIVSPDANYNGVDPADVMGTNTDNDSPGVTLSRITGLVTTEAGGEDTFTIVLNSEPTADVTFAVSSSDTGEGTVSPATVTFTSDNWNAPRTVTATGEDDDRQDGDQPYQIVIGAATSGDAGYMGMDPPNVSAVNNDDDSVGITVTPIDGLITTERAGTATFTVVLDTQPSADVVIALRSSDTTEGTVSLATLTFTDTNWNSPQTVTVTGVDDMDPDGNQVYRIVLDPAMSADTDYDGIDPADVRVTNQDSDDPGIVVTPTSGLETDEAGATATFTVVLNTQPTATVTIALTSSDMGEGTVSPAMLTFTTMNWMSPQTATVTGVNDDLADGDQPYTIVTGNGASTDPVYNGRVAADVSVTNTDDETAGIRVRPTTGLQTTEAGGTATFQITLTSQPTGNVTIPIESSDTTEGTVSPMSVTFTTVNWSSPQTITVTGVNDDIADGNQVYSARTRAASSTDPNYDGVNPTNATITNIDDETAGFTVEPLDLVTREDGALAPTFRVRLNSEPTADVVIAVSSSDTSEGDVDVSSLTFTSGNWSGFQTVTVTGAEDAVADGDVPYQVILAPATSTDMGYDGLDPIDVDVTNVDNDSAGITVTPTTGLVTGEDATSDTFTIQLNSQPTRNVTIDLSSSTPTEGTVSPASVVFTPMNWSSPQTVTVTGVDDFVADGNRTYLIVTAPATSMDPSYAGRDAANVVVTNTDNETAGFTVTPTTGLVVSEGGAFDTFSIVLNSQPTANVTVTFTSGDPSEASVSPASVIFTEANWNSARTIRVTGVDDPDDDGDIGFTILTNAAASADPNYDSRDPANVTGTCTDNDTPGVTVAPTTGLQVSEDGTVTADFSIVLNSRPTANVTISLSSSDMGEGTPSPSMVTFTNLNWNAPVDVTVTGGDDDVADGNQPFTIVTSATASMDMGYNLLAVDDVGVTCIDDETPGIDVRPTSGLLTNEAGRTATFTVRLTSEPMNSVMVPIMSNNTAEGTVSPPSLTFTAGNWGDVQTVTVTGANDSVADGDQGYTISVGAATSADMDYDGLSGSTVSATNLDDETPGITVTPTSGLITSEGGGSDTFTVVLNSQPTGDVIITMTGDSSEGSLSTGMLTFTSSNWNSPRTVTVTGVEDMIADGNQRYFVIGNSSTSMDPDYAALSQFTVEITNTDND